MVNFNSSRSPTTGGRRLDQLRAKRRASLALLDSLIGPFLSAAVAECANYERVALGTLARDGDRINYGVVQPGAGTVDGVPVVRGWAILLTVAFHEHLKRIDPVIESKYGRSLLHGDEILVSCVGSVGVVALATEAEAGFNIARVCRPNTTLVRRQCAIHRRLPVDPEVQAFFRSELRTVASRH